MSLQIVESLPSSSPEWCSIFNSIEFFNLHKISSSVYLSFLSESRLIGVCHFTETEAGVFKSPYRGTFGGIDFIDELDLSVKNECVILLDHYFKNKEVKQVIIGGAPFAHHLHNSSALFNTLLNHGYSISNQDINHTLEVSEVALIEKMMRNNKKRLKKCEREGFAFEQVNTFEEFEKVYSIIEANRKAKGFFISMSFQQIMDMYKVFSHHMYFFKSSFGGNEVASSICIKLNANVLYIFYWGDLPGNEQYSPIAHLANGIYEFAQKQNFKLMDAGTSSISGVPNFGVATFKENLGFTASPKITYSKQF